MTVILVEFHTAKRIEALEVVQVFWWCCGSILRELTKPKENSNYMLTASFPVNFQTTKDLIIESMWVEKVNVFNCIRSSLFLLLYLFLVLALLTMLFYICIMKIWVPVCVHIFLTILFKL